MRPQHRQGCPQPKFEDYERQLAQLLVEKAALQAERDKLQLGFVDTWRRIPNIVRDAFQAGVVWQSDAKETLSTRANAEHRAVEAAYTNFSGLGT